MRLPLGLVGLARPHETTPGVYPMNHIVYPEQKGFYRRRLLLYCMRM